MHSAAAMWFHCVSPLDFIPQVSSFLHCIVQLLKNQWHVKLTFHKKKKTMNKIIRALHCLKCESCSVSVNHSILYILIISLYLWDLVLFAETVSLNCMFFFTWWIAVPFSLLQCGLSYGAHIADPFLYPEDLETQSHLMSISKSVNRHVLI